MSDTVIDLLRHGEPLGGTRYRGQRDDPLSENGWRQMRAAVAGDCPWRVVVSSPLQRCAAFARELADRHDLPLRIDADLREIGFGQWEGRTKEEVEAASPGLLARFYQDPVRNRPPGAESLEAFRERVNRAWEAILDRHGGRRILVVAHAGVIRMVVAGVLGLPLTNLYRLAVPNAGLTRVVVRQVGGRPWPSLVFHGEPRART